MKPVETTGGTGADWPAPPPGVGKKSVLRWLGEPLPNQRRVNAAYERGPLRRDRVEFFLAVFSALDKYDNHGVSILLEVALSITLTLHGGCEVSALVVHSIHFSEASRHATHANVDSFLTFAQKVLATGIKPERETLL